VLRTDPDVNLLETILCGVLVMIVVLDGVGAIAYQLQGKEQRKRM
jgi:hypothetical protein